MEILRTPDARFVDLADFAFAPHYLEIANPGGAPLRIHTLDEGPQNAAPCCTPRSGAPGIFCRRTGRPSLSN